MVVSVTASTTSGKPLTEEVYQKVMDACGRVLDLDEAKKKVRMSLFLNMSPVSGCW